MNIAFCCPKCESHSNANFDDRSTEIGCPHCQSVIPIRAGTVMGSTVARCLICPCTELFVRKDFSQRVGVSIVFLGFAISCVTWYLQRVYWTFAVLLVTALVDLILYLLMKDCLTCYGCRADYRGVAQHGEHGPFDLSTMEKFRQQKIRLRQATNATAAQRSSESGQVS